MTAQRTTKQLKLRRGNTAEHANFIGAVGEITVDTDLKTIRVHDGSTLGGNLLMKGNADTFTLPWSRVTNKPTIPTNVSQLNNDAGYITSVDNAGLVTDQELQAAVAGLTTTIQNGQAGIFQFLTNSLALKANVDQIPEVPTVPTNVSAFNNDANYATLNYVSAAIGGALDSVPTLRVVNTNNSNIWLTVNEIQFGNNLSVTDVGEEGQGILRIDAIGDGTFSGNYNDLIGKPTIPSDVSDLTDNQSLLGPAGSLTFVDLGNETTISNVTEVRIGDNLDILEVSNGIVRIAAQGQGGGTAVSATAMPYTRTGTVDQQNNLGLFAIDNDDSFSETTELILGVVDNAGYNFGSIVNDFDLKDTQLKLTITSGANYGVYLTNSYTPITTSGYRGFKAAYSSVYGAYDPSINQLIFYSDQENPTITANTNTNQDDFTVANISNSSTIGVVVLYGNGDGRISVNDLGAFFRGYVDMVLYDGETLRDAEGIQTAFYANSTSLFNLLPALFDNFSFTPGFSSNYVSDGNNDIYDGGNYIKTNLETNGIPYGDGSSVQDGGSYFGSGSTYVTLQTGSMFSMVAVNSSVTQLGFGGDMGADGGGHRSYGPLDTVYAYQIGLTHIKSSGTWLPVDTGYVIDYEIAGPIVKAFESQWTNPNSENTWGISTWQSGKRVNFVGRTYENQITVTALSTHTNVNYIQFSDIGSNLYWMNTNTNGLKTPHERLEVSVDGNTWYSATSGWGQGGGTIMVYIDQVQGQTTQVSYNQGDPLYLRVAKGTVPEVWFDPNESPNGSGNFRGAIIDYHAYVENGGTIIGTIQIANDGNRNITHSEVTSGNNYNLQYSDLWVYDNFYQDGNGRIAFRTTNGAGTGFNIHWTAKMFYGNDYWD